MKLKHLLVVKLGALGDVIRTSYILPGIHQAFGSGISVTWVTAPAALSLLRRNPHVSTLVPADRFASTDQSGVLGRASFDWVLSLDDERESCEIAQQAAAGRFSGAYVRDGSIVYSEDMSPWFDMGLISRLGKMRADELKLRNTLSHDQIFARMLGVNIDTPCFFNDPGAEQRGRAALGQALAVGGGKKVGLNLGAGKRWRSKSLRMKEAIQLVHALRCSGKACVALGGREDRAYLDDLAGATGVRVINDLALDEFAGLVKGLDLLITSDSLALHLAISQKVPNVSFYAPTSAAEINTFGTGSKIISTAPDYCSYRPEADNSTLTADRILAEVAKFV